MKSDPYFSVSKQVKEVVSSLLHGADDYHRVHKARFARTIDIIYKSKPEGRLLEIGTSSLIPVALAELLPDLEVDVTHFDKSLPVKSNITVTMNEVSREVLAYAVDLEHELISADDSTYDHVICCEVLEHMEIDPMFMLSEVNRVSKVGASLLLTTPNICSSRALFKMSQGTVPHFFMQYHSDRSYHRHNYEYAAPTLQHVMHAAGYDCKVWSEDLFEDGVSIDQFVAAGFNVTNVGDNLIAQGKKMSGIVDRYPNGIYV